MGGGNAINNDIAFTSIDGANKYAFSGDYKLLYDTMFTKETGLNLTTADQAYFN